VAFLNKFNFDEIEASPPTVDGGKTHPVDPDSPCVRRLGPTTRAATGLNPPTFPYMRFHTDSAWIRALDLRVWIAYI